MVLVRTSQSSTPFTERFDKLVHETLQRYHLPGASFAVVQGDQDWTKGYGKAIVDPDEARDVDATTLFYAASTTKAQLCAAWALYLASEENKTKSDHHHQAIRWTTPLASLLREDFVLSDPTRTSQVTLEDAVSHRTGLPRHELAYGFEGVDTPRGLVQNLRNLPLHNEIRTTFEYCNTAFVAASVALEKVTGKSLRDYLKEKLWEPLGMQHTYGGLQDALSAAKEDETLVIAKSYDWSKLCCDPDDANGRLIEEERMDFPEVSGAGYVISCADDYVKWMRCFLDPSSGPLTPELIKELWKPRSMDTGGDHENVPFQGILAYGLGWFVTMFKGHEIIFHPGGVLGAGSYVLLCPDIKFGATFFANGADAGAKLKGLIIELLDAALGTPEGERKGMQQVEEATMDFYKKVSKRFAEAKTRLYPNAPAEPTLPPSRPLEAYAGTFKAQGHDSITFTLAKDVAGQPALRCELTDRTWRPRLSIEHVNADYWIVSLSGGNSQLKSAVRAESKVGVDGTVKAWGIAMDSAMPDVMAWFERST